MFELRRLTAADESAVLAFELENRAYFAQFISDRGDDFYERFSVHHRSALAEQEAGVCLFHVLVDADGSVIGRINLYDVAQGAAVLGYRVAARVAGRGVTTDAVQRLLTLAGDEYALTKLVAVVTNDNPASQRVLEKAGFGVAGPTAIHKQPAIRFERYLERRLSA